MVKPFKSFISAFNKNAKKKAMPSKEAVSLYLDTDYL